MRGCAGSAAPSAAPATCKELTPTSTLRPPTARPLRRATPALQLSSFRMPRLAVLGTRGAIPRDCEGGQRELDLLPAPVSRAIMLLPPEYGTSALFKPFLWRWTAPIPADSENFSADVSSPEPSRAATHNTLLPLASSEERALPVLPGALRAAATHHEADPYAPMHGLHKAASAVGLRRHPSFVPSQSGPMVAPGWIQVPHDAPEAPVPGGHAFRPPQPPAWWSDRAAQPGPPLHQPTAAVPQSRWPSYAPIGVYPSFAGRPAALVRPSAAAWPPRQPPQGMRQLPSGPEHAWEANGTTTRLTPPASGVASWPAAGPGAWTAKPVGNGASTASVARLAPQARGRRSMSGEQRSLGRSDLEGDLSSRQATATTGSGSGGSKSSPAEGGISPNGSSRDGLRPDLAAPDPAQAKGPAAVNHFLASSLLRLGGSRPAPAQQSRRAVPPSAHWVTLQRLNEADLQ